MNYQEFLEYYIRQQTFLIMDIQDESYNYAFKDWNYDNTIDMNKAIFDNVCYNVLDTNSLFHNKLYECYYSSANVVGPKNIKIWKDQFFIDLCQYIYENIE